MTEMQWPSRRVRMLLVDVDGTLTDGGLYYSAEGLTLKRFDVRDGLGLRLLAEAGVEVAIVSADDSPVTTARARKLGIMRVVQGCADKGEAVRRILAEAGVEAGEACFMGDDLTDLAAFAEVGHTAAPADAVPQVRAAAQYVARARAGQGAVREVCDRLRQ